MGDQKKGRKLVTNVPKFNNIQKSPAIRYLLQSYVNEQIISIDMSHI